MIFPWDNHVVICACGSYKWNTLIDVADTIGTCKGCDHIVRANNFINCLGLQWTDYMMKFRNPPFNSYQSNGLWEWFKF